ncbi:MAG: metal-binding protein [Kouleothrix sp.]|nr:metal-binding protein [Kouleothrix sp.]
MPGARTHDAITVVTGLALAPLSYSGFLGLGFEPEPALRGATLLAVGHLLSGIMFSPDLDIDGSIDNRWGIFFWIWRPYMWAVPHRSRLLSHGLVIPPLLRLLYFYYALVGLLLGGAWLLGRVGIAVPDLHTRLADLVLGVARDHPRETWAFLLGFITGSAAHSIADWLVTGGKHFLRRLGLRVTIDYSNHDRWRPRRRRQRSWGR